jgi:hypothetical protein
MAEEATVEDRLSVMRLITRRRDYPTTYGIDQATMEQLTGDWRPQFLRRGAPRRKADTSAPSMENAMSPYEEALSWVRRHPGTAGARGLAKFVLSLWNDECAFALRECLPASIRNGPRSRSAPSRISGSTATTRA